MAKIESDKNGRPTKYDEKYCDVAIKYLKKGKSITQLARELKVSKSTVYLWAEVHERFSDALQQGRELSQAFWEDELIDMMYNKEVNSPLVKLYFANRFGWSDKAETKNENANVKEVKSFSDMYSGK